MHLRMIFIALTVAWMTPILAGCHTSTVSSRAGSASSGAVSDPASSSPPTPHGPVLVGSTYAIASPPGSVIDTTSGLSWSRSFARQKKDLEDITGVVMEPRCGCRAIASNAGLDRLAKDAARAQKVTHTEVRRDSDLTLAGHRFAHVSSFEAALAGIGEAYDTYVDEFVTYYAGRTLDITFTLRGTSTEHAELKALVTQSLSTLQLKG